MSKNDQISIVPERKICRGGTPQQDKYMYEDVSSPTVSIQAIMMILTIAAKENRRIVIADVEWTILLLTFLLQ